jgi:DNA-directed RNA polymerase alpha subunit
MFSKCPKCGCDLEAAWEAQEEQQLYEELAEVLKDTPLEALELSTRTFNCLRYDYKTVGEALLVSDKDLLRIPNFGKKSLAEWQSRKDDYKRTWKSS